MILRAKNERKSLKVVFNKESFHVEGSVFFTFLALSLRIKYVYISSDHFSSEFHKDITQRRRFLRSYYHTQAIDLFDLVDLLDPLAWLSTSQVK